MVTSVSRIAAPVRFVLAMFRLIAGIEADFGKAFIDLLKKQYPDQTVDVNPSSVGSKMLAIARKELQNSQDDAQDAIQDFLTYLYSSKFDFRKETEKGKPGADTWQKALQNMYGNLRMKSMSSSFKKFKKGDNSDEEKLAGLKFKKESGGNFSDEDAKSMKALEKKIKDEGGDPAKVAPAQLKRKNVRDKSIDEAFGKRPEGGGAAEGGEAFMPTGDESALGKALDDKAAIKEFYDLIDSYLPDLKKTMSKDTRALFEVIFDEDEGTFGSDIKANMGQATALRENHPEVWDDFEKKWGGKVKDIKLKWAAYVGELRKKLLDEVWKFIDDHMTPDDFMALKEEFFSDTTGKAVRNIEKEKNKGKADYQRGIDLRKILKARQKGQEKDPKIQTLLTKIQGEMKKDGKDLEEELDSEWEKSGKKIQKEIADEAKKSGSKEESVQTQAASIVASSRTVPAWMNI